ncbi:MAG: bacterial/archaeal transporter family-2 protein [Solirubrobacteraceae bacterium]|jgi:transporter family-2 protein|nr:bacterial/archaeal transporter family-2 protein [Solirubrobacteraceae bacterium]
MDRGAAVLLTALTGGLVALQAPINSTLGRSVGTWQAAFVSFAIGTAALALVAALATGGLGQIGEVRHVSLLYLTGGLLGAAYITSVLVTVRTLGLGGVTAATIAAQLAVSVVVDRFGLLGVTRQPITVGRVAGVVLLGLGTYLVVRD